MSTKDWILLLTPILINGIVISIWQTYLNIKVKRLDELRKRKSDKIDNFIDLLFKSMDARNDLYVCFRSRKDMKQQIDIFNASIQEVINCQRNISFIIDFSKEVEELRVVSGFCIGSLRFCNDLIGDGINKDRIEEERRILNYFTEIDQILQKLCRNTMKVI